MKPAVTDTHSIIWYLADDADLSRTAAEALDEACESEEGLLVPTICIVETVYLVEKRRVGPEALVRLMDVLEDQASPIRTTPLTLEVARELQEIPRDVVPDLPDRVIATTPRYLRVPLVTRDQRIRALPIETIW